MTRDGTVGRSDATETNLAFHRDIDPVRMMRTWFADPIRASSLFGLHQQAGHMTESDLCATRQKTARVHRGSLRPVSARASLLPLLRAGFMPRIRRTPVLTTCRARSAKAYSWLPNRLIAQFLEARLRRWQVGDIIVKTSVGIGDRDRHFSCVQNVKKIGNPCRPRRTRLNEAGGLRAGAV